ncbi:MAG: hypothetical protein CL512_03815 [Actinobacteria bacterium]|nr:hypothetical protein [Actinomycetota bacterium]|tara:strand:+ start:706 stop:1791 length:1086 start_codon:yes stop_codon:yes gene_type:complete
MIAFKGPLNSLSFGNVSLNFLRSLFFKKMDTLIFPVGEKGDLSAFDKIGQGFRDWLQSNVSERYKNISPDHLTLQMWHINGSENRITKNQTLYTFYELDQPTETEINLVKLQDKVIFSSSEARDAFKSKGCTNVESVGLGFDPDFKKLNKTYLEDKIHFGLMGKWEKRKHTEEIIRSWAEVYGENYKYQLTCCVNNPFIKEDQMKSLILNATGGQRIGNINFLNFLPKNSQVNEFINAIDIDLSGLSGAEGWNLPAFNATCMGKWSIVLDCSAHKDWANSENSILVSPNGKEPAADGLFFQENGDFNVGNKYTLDTDEIKEAMKEAEGRVEKKIQNIKGEDTGKEMTYDKSINKILEIMGG